MHSNSHSICMHIIYMYVCSYVCVIGPWKTGLMCTRTYIMKRTEIYSHAGSLILMAISDTVKHIQASTELLGDCWMGLYKACRSGCITAHRHLARLVLLSRALVSTFWRHM